MNGNALSYSALLKACRAPDRSRYQHCGAGDSAM